MTSAGAAATATVAGSPYTIVPSAAVGSGLSNYTISYVNGSLTVNPAVLTVTAEHASKTYGQANPAFTDTLTGFVNSDTSTVVNGNASLTTTATTGQRRRRSYHHRRPGQPQRVQLHFAFANGTLTIGPVNADADRHAPCLCPYRQH